MVKSQKITDWPKWHRNFRTACRAYDKQMDKRFNDLHKRIKNIADRLKSLERRFVKT